MATWMCEEYVCENPWLPCRKSELVKFSLLVYITELSLLVLQARRLVVIICSFIVVCSHFTNPCCLFLIFIIFILWREGFFYRGNKSPTTFFILSITTTKHTHRETQTTPTTTFGASAQVRFPSKVSKDPGLFADWPVTANSNNCCRLLWIKQLYLQFKKAAFAVVTIHIYRLGCSSCSWPLHDVWRSALAALAHFVCLLFLKDFRIICSQHWNAATSLMGYIPAIMLSEIPYCVGCKVR